MSDLALTPMSELDAVNLMLLSIGQVPVNTLTNTGLRDVSLALLWLTHANRTIQSNGWSWNREYKYPLQPDVNGFIMLPGNVLSIEPWDAWHDSWVVRKDPADTKLKLYDKLSQGYVFPTRSTPYYFNIVWMIDFDALPQAAKNYITIRAGQYFQAKAVGSDLLFKFDDAMLASALLALSRVEQRAKGSNLFMNSYAFRRNYNRSY